MLTKATLKRRLLTAFRYHPTAERTGGTLGPEAILAELPDPKPDLETLRAAAEALGREGALEFVRFDPAPMDPAAYVVQPGDLLRETLEAHKELPYTCTEILEVLYCHEEATDKDMIMFEPLAKILHDLDPSRLQRACKHLKGDGLIKVTEANNGIYRLGLTSEGRNTALGRPSSRAASPTYVAGHQITFSGNQNAANIDSPSARISQRYTPSEEAVTLEEVATALRNVIPDLASMGFPDSVEAKIRDLLQDAAKYVEDEEPEPALAESIVKKALRTATDYGDSATKLGSSLTPLAVQLGILVGQYGG